MGLACTELTGFTLVVHMEVLGGPGTGVPPKQQVIDRQLAVSVALAFRQQLLTIHEQKQEQSVKYERLYREGKGLSNIQSVVIVRVVK